MRIKLPLLGRLTWRSLGALAACAIMLVATSCGNLGYDPRHDPALRIGKLRMSMNDRRVRRLLGAGTRALWIDERGQHVSGLLYRNGPHVLATAIDDHHIVELEFFEHMTNAEVHDEFSLPQTMEPYPTSASIAKMSWLGLPVFSDTLPTPPPGWRVPTDFTVAQSGKSFYIVREARIVSKERSSAYGWIVRAR